VKRTSDNWQNGIPKEVYMKSGFRHFMDWWKEHRGYKSRDGVEEALCSLIFNASGYLFEILKEKENYKIPEYELEEGIEKLIKEIQDKMSQTDKVIVVEIAGGSSSGKTTQIAKQIQEKLGKNVLLFSMDNYYKENKHNRKNGLNFDQPEALYIELFLEHLKCLKNNKSIPKLKFCFDENPSKIVGTLQPKKVILIEGLFALNDKLKELGDIKVFIKTDFQGRLIRRLMRNVKERNGKSNDILKYFLEVVEPMHQKYIEQTKNNDDFIINNEYNFEKEK